METVLLPTTRWQCRIPGIFDSGRLKVVALAAYVDYVDYRAGPLAGAGAEARRENVFGS